MKKSFKTFAAALAIIAAVSCAKEVAPAVQDAPVEGGIPVELSVSFEQNTKGYLDGLKVVWEVGDEVAVWDGTVANKFEVKSVSDGGAVISGLVSEGATDLMAVYPFSAFVSVTDGVVAFNVPEEQVVSEDHGIAKDALVSVAPFKVGDASANFLNMTSVLKFKADKEGIQKVVFSSDAELAGASTVTSEAVIACTGAKSVAVKPAGEAFTSGKDYYVSVVGGATATEGNFKAQISLAEGKASRAGALASQFERAKIVDLGAIVANAEILPYVIKTAAQLKTWAARSAEYVMADVVKLDADIDLAGENWSTPSKFLGQFDGQNHRVYNLVIKNETPSQNIGFVGTLGDSGTSTSASVKNIVFGSKDYDFSSKTGTYDGVSKITFSCVAPDGDGYLYPGAIAYAHVGSVVENVVNFMPVELTTDVTCRRRVGAICGTMKASVTVKDCINFGDVTDNGGENGTTALSCGGISGGIDGANCVMENCINYGTVTENCVKMGKIGGIVGYVAYAGKINGCVNKGNIVRNVDSPAVDVHIGGIAGHLYASSADKTFAVSTKDCRNEGNIIYKVTGAQAKAIYVGGFCGQIANVGLTAEGCTNAGNIEIDPNGVAITATLQVGGFAPYGNYTTTIKNCSNSGSITLKDGSSTGVIELGGILGRNVTKPVTLEGCTNTGNLYNGVSTSKAVNSTFECIVIGGLIGRSHQATVAKNCSVSCNITNAGASEATQVGGMIGYTQSSPVVTDFSYTGTITAQEVAGGVASYYSLYTGQNYNNAPKTTGCKVDGTIDIKSAAASATYAGGLYGKFRNASSNNAMSGVDVTCNISGSATNAGILVGLVDASTTATMTLGTAGTDPVKAAGQINGTAASAENFLGAASANVVINL